jgi:predicted SAM-dependent methyltransferase
MRNRMTLRRTVGNTLRSLGIYSPVIKMIGHVWTIFGLITLRNPRVIAAYMAQAGQKKLHIGCGGNPLSGWLNTDLSPGADRIRMDATKKFPFPDNTFDYIFSEHMIEHITYKQVEAMLGECFRVLKPGGVIRLVTPDFKFLVNLYQNDKNDINAQYIKWNSDLFIGKRAPHDAISVVNNYVRDWGHKYIYDEAALTGLLRHTGFNSVIREGIGRSNRAELTALEHAARMPAGFLELESQVLEAIKS